jgi:hypothetical protein
VELKDWLSAIVGAVFGLLLTVSAQDYVEQLFGWLQGKRKNIRGPFNMRGKWKMKYSIGGVETEQSVQFRQFRTKVLGTTSKVPYEYEIKGEVHRNVFIALFSVKEPRSVCEGALLLVVAKGGQELVGKWVGFNETNQADEGPMTLTHH